MAPKDESSKIMDQDLPSSLIQVKMFCSRMSVTSPAILQLENEEKVRSAVLSALQLDVSRNYCLTKISVQAKRSISRVFSLFIVPSLFFAHCPYKGRINRAESVLTGLKPY